MKTDWQLLIRLILEFTTNYYKYVKKTFTLSFMKDKDWLLALPSNILVVQVTLNVAWAILDVNAKIK